MFGVDQEIIMKIAIAFVFGVILGFERSLKRKNASIKTAIVLTITSCLITIVSIEAAAKYAVAYSTPMDPMRLAAQAISGIGFLGAGLIMAKNSTTITGLTTAAIMWSTVGFGIGVGAGFYKEAIVALIFIIIGIELVPYLVKKFGPSSLNTRRIDIKMTLVKDCNLTEVIKEMKEDGMRLGQIHLKDLSDENHLIHLQSMVDEKTYITDVYDKLKKIDGVVNVEIKGL